MTPSLSKKISVISLLLIVMVVVIHCYHINYLPVRQAQEYDLPAFINHTIQLYISQGIARVAVPLFFAISGFLFFQNVQARWSFYVSKWKRRLRTLVLPYLLWSLNGIGVYLVVQAIYSMPIMPALVKMDGGMFSHKALVEYTPMEWVDVVFVNPIPYQLWFIRDLVVLVAISPILYVIIRHTWLVLPVIIGILWIMFGDGVSCFSGLLFYATGACFAIHKVPLEKPMKLWWIALALWLVVVLTMIVVAILWHWYSDYIHRVFVLVGMFSVWYGYDYARGTLESPVVMRLVPYTFFIYAAHEPALTMCKKTLLRVMGTGDLASLTVYIVSPIIVVVLCICVGSVMRRYAVFVFAILTGGRESRGCVEVDRPSGRSSTF